MKPAMKPAMKYEKNFRTVLGKQMAYVDVAKATRSSSSTATPRHRSSGAT
jgi:hypothetical protein